MQRQRKIIPIRIYWITLICNILFVTPKAPYLRWWSCGIQNNAFGTQYTGFFLCSCAFFKPSQGTTMKSPSHKSPWYPALRHSRTVTSLLSLGLIPPPFDHLALQHCGGKCSYSLASHSSLREQGIERQDPQREKIKKKKKSKDWRQGKEAMEHTYRKK